jgi:hypothetical protein
VQRAKPEYGFAKPERPKEAKQLPFVEVAEKPIFI